MIPVDQTKFGPVEGNCFSACVASILEIPLDDVPQFMAGDWWANFSAWCAARNVVPRYWPCKAWCESTDAPFLGVPTGHSIMTGESPRHPGVLHAVVARDGEMVHDPNPSRAGVFGSIDYRDFVTLEIVAVLP